MVQCMVDGSEQVLPGTLDDLTEVVDLLNSQCRKTGRFIAALKVDGRELEAVSQWYLPRKLQGIGTIEVTTGLSAQLAADAIGHADRTLGDLRGRLLQTVELFRSGNDQKGIKNFIELVTGLEWFVGTIGSVGDILQIDFSSPFRDGPPLSQDVDAMNRILLDIIGAQERRDWVLLGDLLEYELEPQMERWQELLVQLRQLS